MANKSKTQSKKAVSEPQPFQFNTQAMAQDNTDYRGYCEKFVEQYTYGNTGIFPSAADAWDSYSQSGKGMTDWNQLQYGDTIYFAPDASNNYAGHTGIYVGNGKMISATYNGVQVTDLNQWIQETGQQPQGFVSHTNYNNVPAPQSWPSQYTQASDNTQQNNVQMQWQDAPANQQDIQGTTTPTQTYTVQAGDTLYGIAQRLLGDGNRWHELQGFSGDPRQLPIGTQLTVPGGQATTNQSVIQQFLPQPVRTLPQQPKTNNAAVIKAIPKNPLPTNPGAKPQAQGNGKTAAPANQTQKALLGVQGGIANPIGTAVTAAGGALLNGAERLFSSTPKAYANGPQTSPNQQQGNPFAQVGSTVQNAGNAVVGAAKAVGGAVQKTAQNVVKADANMTGYQPAQGKNPATVNVAGVRAPINGIPQHLENVQATFNNPVGKAARSLYAPVTNAVEGAVNQGVNAVNNYMQNSFMKPLIPPPADHLLNPVMNRNFSTNMRAVNNNPSLGMNAGMTRPPAPQQQRPPTSSYNLPSNTRMSQPTFARSFNGGAQNQQPTQRTQPNSFVTSAGRVINNVENALPSIGRAIEGGIQGAAHGIASWMLNA